MTNKNIRKAALLRKRKLAINLMINSLRIIFRFLKLLFNGNKMECSSFQPDVEFCIEGTINQLRWNINNSIFITINNSSQLFFHSGQLLFKVKKDQTNFLLTSYGLKGKTELFTSIKVITLNKKDLSNIEPRSKKTAIHKIDIDLNKKILNKTISFQHREQPIPFKQIQIKTDQSGFLQNTLIKINSTSSKEELSELKLLLEPNLK